MMNWTTMGSFWVIASLPLVFYMIYLVIKQKNSSKYIQLFIAALVLALIIFFNKELIYNYLQQAQFYIKGNLYVFGNDFGIYNFSFINTIYYFLKLSILIFTPLFILELINSIKKKEVSGILFFSFLILLPIVSLSYTLGRIDNQFMTRIMYLSMSFLAVMIPYYIRKKFSKTLLILIVIITFFCFWKDVIFKISPDSQNLRSGGGYKY